MVKILVLCVLLSSQMFSNNAYEKYCVECHKKLPTSLQRMFMRYLLVYSGEKNMKAGLRHYLRYPSKEISVMSTLFIDNYGIKKRTKLTKSKLNEALNIYWDKFKVFQKLK